MLILNNLLPKILLILNNIMQTMAALSTTPTFTTVTYHNSNLPIVALSPTIKKMWMKEPSVRLLKAEENNFFLQCKWTWDSWIIIEVTCTALCSTPLYQCPSSVRWSFMIWTLAWQTSWIPYARSATFICHFHPTEFYSGRQWFSTVVVHKNLWLHLGLGPLCVHNSYLVLNLMTGLTSPCYPCYFMNSLKPCTATSLILWHQPHGGNLQAFGDWIH